MNRTGVYKRMIFSGSQRKRSDNFVACEARSKLITDRSSIINSFIKRNKLDITINDKIAHAQYELARLRIMNKIG